MRLPRIVTGIAIANCKCLLIVLSRSNRHVFSVYDGFALLLLLEQVYRTSGM
jgi:hypothetical protein